MEMKAASKLIGGTGDAFGAGVCQNITLPAASPVPKISAYNCESSKYHWIINFSSPGNLIHNISFAAVLRGSGLWERVVLSLRSFAYVGGADS